jgi:hypothetical protein
MISTKLKLGVPIIMKVAPIAPSTDKHPRIRLPAKGERPIGLTEAAAFFCFGTALIPVQGQSGTFGTVGYY